MTGLQLLRRVELPLALPLVAAGLRTAAVQVVATATLAAYVGGGGLGRFIADGFGQADPAMTAAGGVLVAALALLVELLLGALQRRLTPGPTRRRGFASRPSPTLSHPAA
jgi:osmoprotectant transport system permease protein